MRIGTVDDACDFIQRFCHVTQDHPWKSAEGLGIPEPLLCVGSRLGGIWEHETHPYWSQPDSQIPGHRRNLFSIQDTFFDVRNRAPDAAGITMWLDENQGVYQFGYKEDDPRLFVHGDWVPYDRQDWRPVPDTSLEQGVIIMLLASLFWMSMSEDEMYGDSIRRAPRLDVLLFDHPPWSFEGFWTNASASHLHYAGIEQTVSNNMVKHISTGSPFEEKIGYSRAVVADGLIHVAGTTGYDYATMSMPDSIEDQCRNALQTIENALKEVGASLDDVVRVRYIVPNKDEWPNCWPVTSAAFAKARPAATMLAAGLQEDEMKIEIEVTARLP